MERPVPNKITLIRTAFALNRSLCEEGSLSPNLTTQSIRPAERSHQRDQFNTTLYYTQVLPCREVSARGKFNTTPYYTQPPPCMEVFTERAGPRQTLLCTVFTQHRGLRREVSPSQHPTTHCLHPVQRSLWRGQSLTTSEVYYVGEPLLRTPFTLCRVVH